MKEGKKNTPGNVKYKETNWCGANKFWSICTKCDKSTTRECAWARDFGQVDGWDAYYNTKTESFEVHKCPEFVPDRGLPDVEHLLNVELLAEAIIGSVVKEYKKSLADLERARRDAERYKLKSNWKKCRDSLAKVYDGNPAAVAEFRRWISTDYAHQLGVEEPESFYKMTNEAYKVDVAARDCRKIKSAKWARGSAFQAMIKESRLPSRELITKCYKMSVEDEPDVLHKLELKWAYESLVGLDRFSRLEALDKVRRNK